MTGLGCRGHGWSNHARRVRLRREVGKARVYPNTLLAEKVDQEPRGTVVLAGRELRLPALVLGHAVNVRIEQI